MPVRVGTTDHAARGRRLCGRTTWPGWRISARAFPWQSFAGVPGFFVGTDWRDPHFTFLRQIDEWFPKLEAAIPVGNRANGWPKPKPAAASDLGDRGAVWTYLTTDQPFGAWTERLLKGIRKKLLGA